METYTDKKQADPFDVVPVSGSLFIRDQSPFSKALKHVEDHDALERVQMEFAALCNQIMSADGIVARGKEDLAAIVRKACGYLDIAIEDLVSGDLSKAVSLIEKSLLSDIFRVGYGTALELKWKADKWMPESWFFTLGLECDFWDDAWSGLLEGLSRKHPILYVGFSGSGESFRDFQSLKEIRQSRQALDQVMALDRLLALVYKKAEPMRFEGVVHALTYKNLLLTHWARHHMNLKEGAGPLSAQQLPVFFRELWMEERKPYHVKPAMQEAFIKWLADTSGLAQKEIRDLAGEPLHHLFEELEREYGGVSLKNLNWRYVKHFLVVP